MQQKTLSRGIYQLGPDSYAWKYRGVRKCGFKTAEAAKEARDKEVKKNPIAWEKQREKILKLLSDGKSHSCAYLVNKICGYKTMKKSIRKMHNNEYNRMRWDLVRLLRDGFIDIDESDIKKTPVMYRIVDEK